MSAASDSTNRSTVESAVDRVDAVARALTSTTRGVPALQREVISAAALIVGSEASAAMALRDGDQLRVTVSASDPPGLTGFERWEAIPEVLAGRRVRRTVAGQG